MDASAWIALIGLLLNAVTLVAVAVTTFLVYLQIVAANKTNKSQIAVTLLAELNESKPTQEILEELLADRVHFEQRGGMAAIFVLEGDAEKDIYLDFNIFLNLFQIVGHLFHLRVLAKEDLRSLRFELIKIGRNSTVREYFKFLNTKFQTESGVEHDHFANLKELYLAFEYDADYVSSFKPCLFRYQPAVFEPRLTKKFVRILKHGFRPSHSTRTQDGGVADFLTDDEKAVHPDGAGRGPDQS